jgi:transposase
MNVDLREFFQNPSNKRQRNYEAIRALIIEQISIEEVALKYGYTPGSLRNLLSRAKNGKIDLFPAMQPGPTGRRVDDPVLQKIIDLRRQNLSAPDIEAELLLEEVILSARTIERILKDAGFGKLPRRTNQERGLTLTGKLIPGRSEHVVPSKLKPFQVDCPVAGIFFFLPYILESGLDRILLQADFPESKDIGALQANLSMLALKLMGHRRLSTMDKYDHEPGLGIFAGLNVLPKATYMGTYSCRCSETGISDFQQAFIQSFSTQYSSFYQGSFINLDFHSIPHYGEQAEMEKIWCGAKHQTLRGANTVFATDSQSNAILYTRADILRKEEASEILKFVQYWKGIRKENDQTLVFDCKFTSYKILDQLCDDQIGFITLRKRHQKLLERVLAIPEDQWRKAHLPVPKRKHQNVTVLEEQVQLARCNNTFRQIIIKDHGRENPTFIITNKTQEELSLETVLEVYAKRWHVENKLAELVAFFNLNALSSPIMIRIHFDIIWSMIADTLYHLLAQDLRRFEKNLAPTIFNKFIDMPGIVGFDGEKFFVKIRKRAHTPILLGIPKLNQPFNIPWLEDYPMEIVWTA